MHSARRQAWTVERRVSRDPRPQVRSLLGESAEADFHGAKL
jgi:hypothetical protein